MALQTEKNYRYRPKGVFGKGVGNSKNASEMHQKWVLGKEERSKVRLRNASKLRQKCAERLWGRTPLDDTEIIFELIMHLIADTDTDENVFGIDFW